MGKFYVKCGKREKICQSHSHMDAAIYCLKLWIATVTRKQARLEKIIRISEVGFEYDSDDPNPVHFEDLIISTAYVKNLVREI